MSHEENTKLREAFLEECERGIFCPYCGSPNQDDPVLGCCGEVHATEMLEHPDVGVFPEEDLEEEFQYWLNKRGER